MHSIAAFRTHSCCLWERTGPGLILPLIFSSVRSCSQTARPGPKKRGTALCPASSVSDFQSLQRMSLDDVCVLLDGRTRVQPAAPPGDLRDRRRKQRSYRAEEGCRGGGTACRNGVDDLSSSPAKFPARLTHWSRFRLRGRALPRGERSRGSAPSYTDAFFLRPVEGRSRVGLSLFLLSLSASR